jgi:outer membrane protein TolC
VERAWENAEEKPPAVDGRYSCVFSECLLPVWHNRPQNPSRRKNSRYLLLTADSAEASANDELPPPRTVEAPPPELNLPRLTVPSRVPPAPWTDHIDTVEKAVAEAVNLRPEVGAMNSQRRAALANVEAARAGNRPSVNFTGNYYVWTPNFYNGTNNLFVGLAASLNLFDGGRTRSSVHAAQARVAELVARQERLMLDIELEVRRAYLQLSDAQGRLQVMDRAIEQATESFREIGVRYEGQAATISQFIDAQVALTSAEVRRATAQADVEIARANLERAVGRVADLLGR